MNIANYNIRISTLEEVFNEIGKREEQKELEDEKEEGLATETDEENLK
jgi:hypothetical protein